MFFGFICIIVSIVFFYRVIWLYKEQKQERCDLNDDMKELQKFNEFHTNSVIKEHYTNLEKIEIMYKTIYHMKGFNSPNADELIALCQRDISIASRFKQLHQQYSQDLPLSYSSFKRLAYIYEKREEYEKAADVCIQAIRLGFIEDDTTGKMYARLARMIKKANFETIPEKYQITQ